MMDATVSASSEPAQAFRLSRGGLIDRTRQLGFTFDGQDLDGYAGDTLASALLANGVRLVGRSFKYHRPRGILSAGSEEPNALVELRDGARREPNTRATVAELYDGLVARSQNRFPSLRFDAMAVNALLSPILGAGFYYKTFMWPASFWEKVYEPLIRRAAGLGRASGIADPDHYEKSYAFCDVLVIGSGPAGLMAALVAGRAGGRVILAEEDFHLGGRCLSETRPIGEATAAHWAERVEAELAVLPEVRILRRTTVFGAYDHGTYGAIERVADHLPVPPAHMPRQRLWRIVARRAILAAGAIERPLVFGDNDRPGVMLAGAVRTYLNRFGVAPGKRAVVFTNNDDGWRTAQDLAAAGVAVAAVVDPRGHVAASLRGSSNTRVLTGAITRALGGTTVRAVNVLTNTGERITIACDLVAMSGGWNPALHLSTHLGGRPRWDDRLATFVPDGIPAGMQVVGAASGGFATAVALADGARAGVAAAETVGRRASMPNLPEAEPEGTALAPLWRVRGARGKAFIDFQNDVAASDVELARREGFSAVEHLKRYTTLGMATDQGKTANVNGVAIMAELTARSMAEIGSTRFRPPSTPVAIGAFAGHHRGRDFRPTRVTPSHEWASERGAVFVETGPWLRAQWYPQADETDWLRSVSREVTAVRTRVGLCDVSTLGKIDLQGPDAAEFLDRLYVNSWKTLAVGRARYGVMLREDGFVMDDGTTSRLGPDHYLVTTTTANAARVFQHMQFCAQVLWPTLDVQFVSVTEQWAQFSVAGPASRDVLREVIDPAFDLSDLAFPYMAAGDVTVCGGTQARLFRVSFSGERAYEIAVPANLGDALVRRLMQAGKAHGITPYGTEALGVLRIEKGHVAGNEINGQTTARDLGLGRMLSGRKDYIGRVMAARAALTDPARPTLVGLKPCLPNDRLRAGAHLLALDVPADAAADQGYVTSVAFSPTLGHWIGLGLLSHGPERWGDTVRAYDPVRHGDVEVEVCAPVFVDPEGERLCG